MKLLKQLGSVSVILLLITTLCWGSDGATWDSALREGNTDEARRLFWKDIEEFGDSNIGIGMKYIALGKLFRVVHETGEYDFGIAMCDETIKDKNPSNWDGEIRSLILKYRGQFWTKKGEYDKAMSDYSKSVEILAAPSNLSAMAWFLATCPDSKYRDGKKAIEYAKKAIEEEKDERQDYFNTLAAAYAEEGNFQEAIKAQEKAISLLKEYEEETRAEYEKRLSSYKAEKPWRMEPPKTE